MKKYIDESELFPFYKFTDVEFLETEVDVTDEFIEKYERIMSDFYELQKELGELYKQP